MIASYALSVLPLASAEGGADAAAVRGNLRRSRLLLEVGEEDGVVAKRILTGAVPLDGEFFLMFFLVLLIVFAVLLGPVAFKCARRLFCPPKVGENTGPQQGQTHVTKEDLFQLIHIVKEKTERESERVRGIHSERSHRVQEPKSGEFYGTYVANRRLRGANIELSFNEHPDGGFEIRGKGGVQSGNTAITDGFLAPDGAAYWVEVGGCNPNAIGKDVRQEELEHHDLKAEEVTKLIVLYSGIFDFTQGPELFKGWRHASTGKFRPYRLSLPPSEDPTPAADVAGAFANEGAEGRASPCLTSTRGDDGSENIVVVWSDRK